MIRLDNITVECTFRARCIDPVSGEELWDKIIDLAVPTNSKLLKGFVDTFFFKLPNGSVVGKDLNNTDINISGILLAVGDGTNTTVTGTLPVTPVKPSTVEILYTVGGTNYTATDDGSGNITGDQITSGSVDYTTGDINIEFATAPDSCSPVTANYTKAAIAEAQTGFKLVLSTDDNPVLTEADFANTVDINTSVNQIDWYQTETENVYEVTLTGTYSETDPSNKVTGIGIVYIGLEEQEGSITPYEKIIFKSIVPNVNTSFFGSEGLILRNTTDITATFRIVVSK